MVILKKERMINMGKKIGIITAFVVALFASFSLGYLVSPDVEIFPNTNTNTGTIDSDSAFLEVRDALIENHYKQPSEELLMQGAIEGMISILEDPFTSYFDYEKAESYTSGFGESYVGIGVTVQFLDGVIVVQSITSGGPADTAGILPNDVISSVNGVSTEGADFYATIGNILGEEGTEVMVGITRTGVEQEIILTMIRATIENPTVVYQAFSRSGSLVGYIKVNTFGDETAQLFHNAIIDLESQGIDSLIIDLRSNGGGYLTAVTYMLQEFLVDNGNPMFSTEAYVDGVFSREEYMATLSEKKPYDIVTLVNGASASASEVFSSAMQEQGGYPVIGTTTYGKGTMQTNVPITATLGDSLHITIGKWFTSDDNWVHYDGGTDGVTPDVVVELSIYKTAYKVILFNEEELLFNTVDARIANIQVILNTMGYTVRMDGYFDQATQAAILDIQTTNGLTTSGNIDSDTMVIINEAIQAYQADVLNDNQLEASIEYLLND